MPPRTAGIKHANRAGTGGQLGHERAVNQVALVASGDGIRVLRINQIATADAAHPRSASELHLGSQDLIRFAGYAATQGFAVSSFMIADAHLSPIGGAAHAEASARMVEILRAWDGDELEAAMGDDFDNLYVVGVNVVSRSTGLPISVRRRGYVVTPIVGEAEKLLASAWQELKLS